MDKRLLFQRRSIVNSEVIWTDDFHDCARGNRETETTARFELHYRTDIRPDSHRILWDGAKWAITSAIPERRTGNLIISCDFSEAIQTTDLDAEHQEYIEQFPVIRPPEDD